MSPSPTRRHQRIVGKLFATLEATLEVVELPVGPMSLSLDLASLLD